MNRFEIELEVLDYLAELLQTKKCILYIFGNPYALQVIPNCNLAREIVVVYQDFEVFQEVASQQLIQNSLCVGSLPVTIDF